MAAEMRPSLLCLENHMSVRIKDCVVIISSDFIQGQKVQEIWCYNLWTEQWREYPIPQGINLESTLFQCAVAIGSTIYAFGSRFQRILWKPEWSESLFECNIIDMEDSEMPLARSHRCGWEHGDKMWIFGGYGDPPNRYLNDHGEYVDVWSRQGQKGYNNQLLCYDPSINVWKNVECLGDVPSPRLVACAAKIMDKVWLYGGETPTGGKNDMFELNMSSLAWTKLYANDTQGPQRLWFETSSLTPIAANQLVFRGDKYTWILDVQSYMWRKLPDNFNCQNYHTGITGLNNDVIFFGGRDYTHRHLCSPIFSVMFGPKRLQQLAMKFIYEHREELPWKSLPSSLIHKMMDT